MIRNIVFDLGNVLISFKPDKFLEQKGYQKETRDTILSDIFRSEEWLSLDKGEFTTEEVINAISLKSSLKRDKITALFNSRTEIMFPLTENVQLLPALKEKGFKLYYLSNFHDDIFDDLKISYAFFSLFDGGIISARVKLSKPDSRIYSVFLETYNLIANDTLFIDDSEINILAAESLGMKGIHYKEKMSLEKAIWSYLK